MSPKSGSDDEAKTVKDMGLGQFSEISAHFADACCQWNSTELVKVLRCTL